VVLTFPRARFRAESLVPYVVGLAALASGTAFLTNLFGYGKTGTLLSGGSIALLNWASAIAVTVAMVILFAEFLETYYVPLEREDVAS